MGELSDRFAELMARLARTDADLYRTIGEQNASVRRIVEDLTEGDQAPMPLDPSAAAMPAQAAVAPLPAAALLPPEQCELKALKARFGKVGEAQSWLEAQIGKAPKKPTWAVIEQTCRQGAWPVATSSKPPAARALTAAELDQRLASLEQRLEQRLLGLEQMLRLIAEAVVQDR